jgi:hypothetical protein
MFLKYRIQDLCPGPQTHYWFQLEEHILIVNHVNSNYIPRISHEAKSFGNFLTVYSKTSHLHCLVTVTFVMIPSIYAFHCKDSDLKGHSSNTQGPLTEI